MRLAPLRGLVALLSIALAGGVLGLTLGLWERSSIVLGELQDVVGRHTWLLEQVPVVGVQPPPLPQDEGAYEGLRALPGVQRLALSTGSTRMIGAYNYPLTGVTEAFFAVRRLELAEGRLFAGPGEAVVGGQQAELLGQAVEIGTVFGDGTVRVVGVLAPVAGRDAQDWTIDQMVFVPLEAYAGPAGVVRLYLEVAPEHFEETGAALEGWLLEEGFAGYEVAPLAEGYGVALRDRVASLLGGALGFGVAAALLAAGANLLAFYLAGALSRLRQTGVRRAVGAARGEVVREEVIAALPWAAAGLLLSLPLIALGSLWLERETGLSAQPGPLTLLLLALGVLVLVALAALLPALWGARQPPAQALRGLASRLPQRRLWLAGAGLALGVAGLVLQASSARSAEGETERILGRVNERVAVLASIIGPGASGFGDPRATVSPTPRDYEALLASEAAQALSRLSYTVRYSNLSLTGPGGEVATSVRAYDGDFPTMIGAELLAGRWPDAGALEMALGVELAEDLYGPADPLGDTLTAFGREWTVVGVFRTGERGIPGGVSSAEALVPRSQVRARGGLSAPSLTVEVAPGRDVRESLGAAAAFLTSRYDPETHLPFSVLQPADAATLFVPVRETLETLSTVYRILALALLLLGGAGLAAQMLVSLSLRVREIGIRRATGASKGAIFRQFLSEALELGLAAGTVGIVLGIALSLVAARVQEVSFVLDWSWTALALAVALLVAALFSAGPARSASSIPPARAMREHA